MSVVGALRQSNFARLGTFALIILFYIVYTLGVLLQFGFGGLDVEPIVTRVGIASVALIIALGLVRWFFKTKVES